MSNLHVQYIAYLCNSLLITADGTSDNPCSGNYHGGSPASQPETQVIQTELVRLGPGLTVVVSVHTAAQMWLHPVGYTDNGTCARAVDHDALVGTNEEFRRNTFMCL